MPQTFTVDGLGDAADMTIDGSCDTDGGADDTPCTLRAAIQESNASGSDDDTIAFDASIADDDCEATPADCTITVGAALPSIGDLVTVNGCSSDPNRPQPCVGVRAVNHLFTVMLVGTANVTVRGLAFVDMLGGLRYGSVANNGTIRNNWFGLDLDGSAGVGGTSLQVGGSGTMIGGPGGATGTAPADRNVFANSTLALSDAVGLQFFDAGGSGADNNDVQGNYFGTGAQGTAAMPNGDNIKVIGSSGTDTPTDNVIGGTVAGAAAATGACDGVCNVISAADSNSGEGHGIDLAGVTGSESPAQQTVIQGNFIGTDVTGTVDLGNDASGVSLDNPNFPALGLNNRIGGVGEDSADEQNLISNSGGPAITIDGSGSNGNLITRNIGSGNGGMFIDLGPDGFGNAGGPNAAIESPVVDSASSQSVTGSGAAVNATIRVYRTTAAAGADPTQITAFVGEAAANGAGNWALTCPSDNSPTSECGTEMPGSGRITVNQSDPNDNSSELTKARAYGVVLPNTTITSGPTGLTNDRTPTFGFTSNEAGSSFQCQVDGGAFASCSSPRTTAALSDGAHTFQARARDTGGNLDPSPAARAFTVDATAPVAEITKGPKRKVKSKKRKKKAKFLFGSDDPDATFECSLDDAEFEPCASPFQRKVRKGTHVLEVRATDEAGNVGDPDEHAWKLKRKR